MAGRRATPPRSTTLAQVPAVADEKVQRALDVLNAAVHELQSRRMLDQFTDTEAGYVPASGGAATDFLAADGTWKTVVGAGAVDSVTAGSSAVTATPTTGAVVIDVVEANFSGIPEAAITFSGTNNVVQKISGTTLVDSTITDTGALVTVASPLTVTGASIFNSTVSIEGNATIGNAAGDAHVVNGTVDFNHNVNMDGTLTLSLMTPGSVLFAGTGGVVSQDNAGFFYDDTQNFLGIGTNAPTHLLTVRGTAAAFGNLDVGRFQNDATNGYSAFGFYDTTGLGRGFFGFGNSNTSDATVRSRNYWNAQHDPAIITHRIGAATNSTISVYVHPSNGNVNIGSTAGDPGSRLRVQGNLDVTVRAGIGTVPDNNHPLTFAAATGPKVCLFPISATQAYGFGIQPFVQQYFTADNAGKHSFGFGDSDAFTERAYINGAGDVSLNIGGGATTINGNLSVLGNTTIGNAAGDAHVVNGTVDFNQAINVDGAAVFVSTVSIQGNAAIGNGAGDAHTLLGTLNLNSTAGTNGQIAQVSGGVPVWGAPSTASIPTGTGTANTLVKWTGASTQGNGWAEDNGTIWGISGKFLITEATGQTSVMATTTRGAFSVASADTTSTFGSVWDDKFSIFGPNVNSTTGAALGLGYNTTGDTARILSVAPGVAWKPMQFAADSFAFRIADSATAALSVSSTTTTVTGALTVNGALECDAAANIDGALTVGGGVVLGNDATTTGDQHSVNGQIILWGVDTGSVFNYSGVANQDSYVRAGRTGGAVYIGDNNTGGINIGAAGNATAVLGSLEVRGNATLGDAGTDAHVINGTLDCNHAVNIDGTFTVNNLGVIQHTASADTVSRVAFQGTSAGTFDTTGGLLQAFGTYCQATATRSAGGNPLWNIGGYYHATGGQINQALRTDQGDVILNAGGGETVCERDLTVKGNATICDAAGDTLKFHGGTGATQQTVTGSRGGNAALADLLTKLATLGLIVDGTTA